MTGRARTTSTGWRLEEDRLMTQPTPEGLRRYPTTEGYFVFTQGVFTPDPERPGRLACVCTQSCPTPCVGDCGCEACIWRDVVDNELGQTYLGD
jgi:hypothetical protein